VVQESLRLWDFSAVEKERVSGNTETSFSRIGYTATVAQGIKIRSSFVEVLLLGVGARIIIRSIFLQVLCGCFLIAKVDGARGSSVVRKHGITGGRCC
jgi:hypothetical protein